MEYTETQGGVSADWVRAEIDRKLASTLTDVSNLTSYVYDVLKPSIDLIDADLTVLEDRVNELQEPDLTEIENKLKALEVVWNKDMEEYIDLINEGLATVEATWNEAMVTKIETLVKDVQALKDYVYDELYPFVDDLAIRLTSMEDDIINVIKPGIIALELVTGELRGYITTQVILLEAKLGIAATLRHAWDWYPETTASQWLAFKHKVFPGDKNILKLWLARIME